MRATGHATTAPLRVKISALGRSIHVRGKGCAHDIDGFKPCG
jgi:hypothetical protein